MGIERETQLESQLDLQHLQQPHQSAVRHRLGGAKPELITGHEKHRCGAAERCHTTILFADFFGQLGLCTPCRQRESWLAAASRGSGAADAAFWVWLLYLPCGGQSPGEAVMPRKHMCMCGPLLRRQVLVLQDSAISAGETQAWTENKGVVHLGQVLDPSGPVGKTGDRIK